MAKVIRIWEAPRSRGTCIAYALYNGLVAQGYNCSFHDEPFNPLHMQKVKREMGQKGFEQYLQEKKYPETLNADYVIQKEQAKWLYYDDCVNMMGTDLKWVRTGKNVILIRDVAEMICSHDKELKRSEILNLSLSMEHVGTEQLCRLHQAIKKRTPLIVDVNELTEDPKKGLTLLARELSIPYSPSMVSWDKVDVGTPLFGGHWYDALMKSKGILPYEKKDSKVPDELQNMVSVAQQHIEKLSKHRLQFTSLAM